MINITFLFGVLALMYGLCMVVFACAGSLPWFQFTHSESTLISSFIGSVFFLSPFLIVTVNFDLKYAEVEEDPFSRSRDRTRQLTKACWMYPACWYLPFLFMIGSGIGYFIVPDLIQPLYALPATFAFVSGLWFVFVHPIARKLFG